MRKYIFAFIISLVLGIVVLDIYAQSISYPGGGGNTITGAGCIPSGGSGNVQYSNGAGACSDENAFNYNAGTNTLTLDNLLNTQLATLIAIAAPATPAAGKGNVYVDSTSKNFAVKDDAGVVKHGVQTATCTNQFASAISDAGGVTCTTVSLTSAVSGDLPFANLTPASVGSILLGRGASGAGDYQEITLGTNLSITGTTLNASGGGGTPGGVNTQVQFNDSGSFGGDAGMTYDKTTDTLTLGGLVITGAGAGYTQWTTGAMAVGASGTVKCGANSGNVLSCSQDAGTVTAVPLCGGDLACASNATPTVKSLTLTAEGQLGSQAITTSVANEGTTGTTVKLLAKLTGAPSTAIKAGTGDTTGVLGVVVAGAGTVGNARIATVGQTTCTFDAGGVTAGHYVIASTVTAGNCRSGGATYPTTGVQVLGRSLQTVASGDASIVLFGTEAVGSSGGGAPTTAKYIVAQLDGGLSAEIAPTAADQVPVSTSSSAAAWGTVTPAAGGVAQVTTANVGGFLAPLGNPLLFKADNSNNPGANVVEVSQFVLPFILKVTKITVNVVTAAASSNCGFGIYDSAGTTKLLESGAIVTTSTGGKSATLGSPVTLNPGVYFAATTCDNGTVILSASSATSAGSNFMNLNFKTHGTGANASSAAVLPSTIGAITATSDNIPVFWMHP